MIYLQKRLFYINLSSLLVVCFYFDIFFDVFTFVLQI